MLLFITYCFILYFWVHATLDGLGGGTYYFAWDTNHFGENYAGLGLVLFGLPAAFYLTFRSLRRLLSNGS